jgi:GDPmannose 4,6-dehydratase
LQGDLTKAKKQLGWSPKVRFRGLVAEMVREDLKAPQRDKLVKRHGYLPYEQKE